MLFSSAILCSTTLAEEDENKDLAVDAATANSDFAIQGEYVADAKEKFAAQIIALGGGNFRVCHFKGGLPGSGWDGKNKACAEAKIDDGKLTLTVNNQKTLVNNDGMMVQTDPDKRIIKLKKVLRKSPTLGAKPPKGAIVLFDGKNADEWHGSMDERNLLKSGATTKRRFTDFQLHLEFILPYKPYGREQGRGNSGAYFQQRYECQILDSFGLEGENNECGGIYSFAKPLVNMCYPPLSWQTYDVDFTAATWKDGKKITNARVTIKHNGVMIHQDFELKQNTPFSEPEGDSPGSLYLQDHGNPVFFRNIWLKEK